MYIRCPSCKSATRLELGAVEGSMRCGMCGARWHLRNTSDLGKTPQERFRRADEFARKEKIDLASAYSVLLGLMPRSAAIRIVSDDKAPLTGDRVIRASTLSQRHDLPMDLAFSVAKGEMSINSAKLQIESRKAASRSPAPVASRTRSSAAAAGSHRVWLIPVVCGLAVGGAIAFLNQEPRSSEPGLPPALGEATRSEPEVESNRPPERLPNTAIETSPAGTITRITGTIPQEIVEAYCISGAMPHCEPLGVRPTVPHRPGVLNGLIKRSGEFHELQAIWIRRDAEGRWFAGNGVDPLESTPFD